MTFDVFLHYKIHLWLYIDVFSKKHALKTIEVYTFLHLSCIQQDLTSVEKL
jgi:hypothetical protein